MNFFSLNYNPLRSQSSARPAIVPERMARGLIIILGMSTALPSWAVEIDESTTTPVLSSTANDGQADDIAITEDGEIDLSGLDGTIAVTIDSDNTVTNEGEILADDTDNVTAINVRTDMVTSITHVGTIEFLEDYDREDEDDDDDLDGPLALGTNRVGINVDDGGTLTGNITLDHGSSIVIEGNNSAGVHVRAALDGDYTQQGTISVIGDNALGLGLEDVTGDVLISGAITAQGANASALEINGDISGKLTIESAISSTGFTSTTATNYLAPIYIDDDTEAVEVRRDADDLYDNASGVHITGSLGQGLLINGAVDDFTSEEDEDDETKDTVDDFDENRTAGRIYSYGSAPALVIKADSGEDLVFAGVVETIRDTADDDDDDDVDEVLATFSYDQGLINRGTIYASGVNIGFDAMALSIAGSDDGTGTVTIDGGILNSGSIQATAFEASSVGLMLGEGTTVGTLVNSGSISSTVYTLTDDTANALVISSGSVLNTILNSGSITASSNGYGGAATSIADESDTLRSITNTGAISALLVSDGRDDPETGSSVAIDLSAQIGGATIVQYQETPTEDVNGDDEIDEDDVIEPTIYGDILFGRGDDILKILDGGVAGDISFREGAAIFQLSDAELLGDISFSGETVSLLTEDSEIEGDFDFGAATGTIDFLSSTLLTGNLTSNAYGLNASISDSEIILLEDTSLKLASLSVTDGSTLEFKVDPQNVRTTPFISVSGTAALDSDTTIRPTLTSFIDGDFDVTLIEADMLAFDEGTTALSTENVPWVYNVTLEAEKSDTDELNLDFRLKTADELNLDSNQSGALSAILDVATSDDEIGSAITQLSTQHDFLEAYNLLLPQRTDAATRYLESQSNAAFGALRNHLEFTRSSSESGNGPWVQETYSHVSYDGSGDGPGYDGRGLGLALGFDRSLFGIDAIGIMGTMTDGKFEEKTGGENPVTMKSLGIGLYASEQVSRVNLQAVGQIAKVDHSSYREIDFADYASEVSATWDGLSTSASFVASTELRAGAFRVTPSVGLDYFKLDQDGYSETASNGLNLWVSGASTDRATADAGLGFSYVWRGGADLSRNGPAYATYTQSSRDRPMLRAGLDIGYRTTLSSTPYEVDAGFVGFEDSFTLSATEAFEDAATVGLSLLAGSELLKIRFGVDGEFSTDATAVSANASVKLRF
jgi:Autotransporter beta-domain